MGRLDVGDPVAHRLVDRVLERRRAGRHRAHLGAQGPHPQHVRALALDVLGAHVDHARQVEQRAGGRGRHAMLTGAGLGDHPGLAQAAGQQRLAERVVDLVSAGVGEVFALEVEPQTRDPRGLRPVTGEAGRLEAHGVGQAIGAVQGGRSSGERPEELAQLGPEDRVLAKRVVCLLELLEGGHQGLGDVAAAEVALHPPSPGAIRVEQAGVDRGGPERDVRPVVAGGAGPLDEQGDAERILGRASAGHPRRLDARGDIDRRRRHRSEGGGDVGRREPAGEDDRQLARDRGGDPFRCPRAGATGVRAAGRVEHDPVDAGRQVGAAARDEVGDGRRRGRPAPSAAPAAPSRSAAPRLGPWRSTRCRRAGRRPGPRRRRSPRSGPDRRRR